MSSPRTTSAFPPSEEGQATLANWMTKPFNEWGFRNIRQILPTANIRRAELAANHLFDLRYLDDIRFESVDGKPMSLKEAQAFLDIDGLIILHRGSVVHEFYDHGFGPRMQHIVFSVTKSFTGTLAGILADQGKVDPDAAVTAYIPEAKASAYSTARVRHLLDMSVGISFSEDYVASGGDFAKYRRSMGWIPNDKGGLPSPHMREFLLSLPASGAQHGETFHYVSPNTDVLGWVFERACGAPFSDLLQQHIWEPLGAHEDAYIGLDSRAAARPAGGFCATIRDLALFGEMMRNSGVSRTGKQVVPRWWIDDIQRNGDAVAWKRGEFTKLFPEGNYRNKWYTPDRSRSAFCAIGIHGQYIYVDPEDEMVVVRVSSQPVAFEVSNDKIWMRACRAIGDRLNGR